MPIDYSKWDNLQVSSSDDDTSHQNNEYAGWTRPRGPASIPENIQDKVWQNCLPKNKNDRDRLIKIGQNFFANMERSESMRNATASDHIKIESPHHKPLVYHHEPRWHYFLPSNKFYIYDFGIRSSSEFGQNSMPRDMVEEWIYEVYNTRCMDDADGYGNFHGICVFVDGASLSQIVDKIWKFDSDYHKAITVISDLIKFLILAVDTKNLPKDFNFSKFLQVCIKPLAQVVDYYEDKMTMINGVARLTDRPCPSLRMKAQYIYQFPMNETGTEAIKDEHNLLEKKIKKALGRESIELANGEIFVKIGGKDIWVDFFNNIEKEITKCIARRALVDERGENLDLGDVPPLQLA